MAVGDGDKLVGFFGKFAIASNTEVSTGTLEANVKYIVKTIGGSSALPAGVEVGKGFVSDGTEDISASSDVVIKLTEVDNCGISSWSIDYSKSELDASGLCDEVSVYLTGRPDLSGNIEGFYKIGETDVTGGILNSFVDIVRQAGAGGAVSVDDVNDDQVVLMLYKQKDTSAGSIEQLYIAPAVYTGYGDTVNGNEIQSFTTPFRIAPNDDIKFHMLSITHS